MNILYGKDWRNLPNHYELFTDVVNNLPKYKTELKEILLQNLLPKKPLIENPAQPPSEPELEEPVIQEPKVEEPIDIKPEQPSYYQSVPLHVHDNCRCMLEKRGTRWVWIRYEDCCSECERLANEYNNNKSKRQDFPISKELNLPILVS
jgi:hypothetical protein